MILVKKTVLCTVLLLVWAKCFCWGFFGHKKVNNYSVFLLPPEMLGFYKQNIDFITEHSVDPDKRRYAIAEEGPRHYIDIDHYGAYPYDSLPRNWNEAVAKYTADTLGAHGIGPWWTLTMLHRLTDAFKEKNKTRILKLSAEIGHYIADLHVPLHTSGNHNGQKTGQHGIHGFWESRLPELLADKQWDFFIGKADYLKNPGQFLWARVLESAAAADTVLTFEAQLNRQFPSDRKYAYENRNGITIRQYSSEYSIAYDNMMRGMVERRMRQSIYAVASFWYTAWVNAGQPDLNSINNQTFSEADLKEFEELNRQWQSGNVKGRSCD
jgi:hypothetical protein